MARDKQKNEYSGIKRFEVNEKNPFVEKAITEISKSTITRMTFTNPADSDVRKMIVNRDGEVEGETAFMKWIRVDEEKFAKVYLSQFAAFWDLPKSAIRVFGYILSTLIPNYDRFTFRLDQCKEHTGYQTKKPIFQGLAALIENGIIARTKYSNEYFINPLVVFNGNRVTFATTYVRRTRKKELEDPNQLKLSLDHDTKDQDKKE